MSVVVGAGEGRWLRMGRIMPTLSRRTASPRGFASYVPSRFSVDPGGHLGWKRCRLPAGRIARRTSVRLEEEKCRRDVSFFAQVL